MVIVLASTTAFHDVVPGKIEASRTILGDEVNAPFTKTDCPGKFSLEIQKI